MKVVIQRVIQASVTIQQQLHASIGRGIMILVGIQADDHEEDIEWLSSKICNLRIFDDENGIMNRSILETAGEILAVSQFTLMARTKKGNRPSYIDAAKPEISVPLYEKFVQAPSNRAPKARREKQASRLVLTSRDAMLIGEGKKLQEPFLSLICLAPN